MNKSLEVGLVMFISERSKEQAMKWREKLGEEFIKLSNMRDFTKMIITQATFGVRRPMSTTFVDIFKGYNAVVYTKIKFQVKRVQKGEIVRRWNHYRPV